MEPANRLLLEAIERSLRFELEGCDVTRMASDHSTGWRTLPGCVTAHILGTEVEIGREDAPVRIRDGECAVIAPGVRHISSVVRGAGTSRWSQFSCWIFGSIDVLALLELPPRLRGDAARRVGDLNQELAAARRDEPDALRLAVRMRALGFQVVDELVRGSPLKPHGQALLMHAERLAPVLDHIESRLATPLTRTALARVAGLSPSRFNALFRSAVGLSPLDYLLRRRVQRAQQLLIATDLDVAVIAERVGFADPFYFSRLFKRRCGATPSDYRRAARSGFGPA
jgi:AraC-like DNA-binding protein